MDSQETTFIPDGDIQMFTSIIDALGIYWKRGLSEFVAVLEDRYFIYWISALKRKGYGVSSLCERSYNT